MRELESFVLLTSYMGTMQIAFFISDFIKGSLLW